MGAWSTFKVFECLIPEDDGLFNDIVQEDLIVRCQDDSSILIDEIALEPESRFQILDITRVNR